MKRILLTGGSGLLGKELRKYYGYLSPSHREMDITDAGSVKKVINKYKPELIVHAAAYTDVSGADKEPDDMAACYLVNVIGTRNIVNCTNQIPIIYISSEYVLAKEGLIPESVFSITSITTKTSRTYSNFLGSFSYKSIKPELFGGYQESFWQDKIIYIASKAKALFDYFYLKKMLDIEREIYDSRINWDNFIQDDLDEFEKYVTSTSGRKMFNVLKLIKKTYVD